LTGHGKATQKGQFAKLRILSLTGASLGTRLFFVAQPGEHRTPGQLIASLLSERGWNQRTLAIVLGVGETIVNKIVQDVRPVDAAMAISLGELFKIDPKEFLHLQMTLDLGRAQLQVRPDPQRSTRASLFGDLPVADMIRRRWLDAEDVRDVPAVEKSLIKFFGAPSLDEIEILPSAAKRTNVVGGWTAPQLAWLYRVKTIADGMFVGTPYRHSGLRRAVVEMKRLLESPEESRKVPRLLEESGVRFMLVESLPSAKIDGVTFWLNEFAPVIALSVRLDRIDNFWFVLRHEIEHVLQGHGQVAMMLDTELEGAKAGVGDGILDEERVANDAAANFCIPQASLDSFIARKEPFFNERDVLGFAKTRHVHPGIVAGQLQHKTGRYDRFRSFQVKIRAHVAPSAIVDGWGDVAPTD
jgi:HTH-type transcriptional regulator/antitoxin HigA